MYIQRKLTVYINHYYIVVLYMLNFIISSSVTYPTPDLFLYIFYYIFISCMKQTDLDRIINYSNQ